MSFIRFIEKGQISKTSNLHNIGCCYDEWITYPHADAHLFIDSYVTTLETTKGIYPHSLLLKKGKNLFTYTDVYLKTQKAVRYSMYKKSYIVYVVLLTDLNQWPRAFDK